MMSVLREQMQSGLKDTCGEGTVLSLHATQAMGTAQSLHATHLTSLGSVIHIQAEL